MFVAPGSSDWFGKQLTKDMAERIARNWSLLLVEGLTLIVCGVLIFSIDWSVRSLSIFIGALFILHGASTAFISGLDPMARRTNVITGLLSIAAGVAIIVWPHPGLVAVAVFLGAWLIVIGTLTVSGSFAGRHVIPQWGLWLVTGVLEVALGVLALADPGSTLAALITVAGIWAVVIGVLYVVAGFELRKLPEKLTELESDSTPSDSTRNGASDGGYRNESLREVPRRPAGAAS
jgi:uncharacterized membrane protein HdeD (DUF308 family)